MSKNILQSQIFADFACTGDACPDTCCKEWGMQVDAGTIDLWTKEQPELLDVVESGEDKWVMKRSCENDFCIKFDNGLCSIHKSLGDKFLGDACNFFPRIIRKVGDTNVMTGSLSCPEIARLALFDNDNPFAYEPSEVGRLPNSMKTYEVAGIGSDEMLQIHQAFVDAVDDEATPERIISRLSTVARSLEMLDKSSWLAAIDFYMKNADARLPEPEQNVGDAFNLLQALTGLISAARKSKRKNLQAIIKMMESALGARVIYADDGTVKSIKTSDDSYVKWLAMEKSWQDDWGVKLNPVMLRWIKSQLATSLFPFSGLGDSLSDKITILGVRFATAKLALVSLCSKNSGVPDNEEIIFVLQGLARFMDHLADPELSLKIYDETGWVKESRLRSLVGDISV